MTPTRLETTRTGMPEAPSRAGWPGWLRRPGLARRGAVLALAALLMGLIGPFGTYLGMALPVRLMHFAATVTSVSLVIGLIRWLVRRWLFSAGMPLWGELVVAAIAAPPGGLVILGLLNLTAPHALPFVTWPELAAQTLVINVAILLAIHGLGVATAGRDMGTEPLQAAAVPEPAPDDPSEPAGTLRQKLPLPLRRAQILSLSAEDHYVRVATDRGATLVLIPLSEAVDALGPEAGLRIHRSHWIARQALEAPGATVMRTAIRLADGTQLPVSRTGRRALVEAGLA
ncbi:LytTR family DNA-binding domain-containing protein [Phreatobacter sp.]|uniref:LytTR family DNA-binding domain-containing protein n=1 Tax=Phreatobacter sp. TaxID=1966341 RepID=UPI003F6F6FA7